MSLGLFDRIPPHAEDMEKHVLGAMLLDRGATEVAVEMLRAEDFYATKHVRIFECAARIFEERNALDAAMLREELGRHGLLDETGGAVYLADLAASVPTSAHVEHYCRTVRDKSIVRQLVTAATEIVRTAYENGSPTSELLQAAEQKIYRLSASGLGADDLGTDARGQMLALSRELETGASGPGLRTGIPVLDNVLGGLRPGELVIVGARPNIGKTTLALNIMRNVAVERPVLLFSLEMTTDIVGRHLVRQVSGVDCVTRAPGSDADMDRVLAAVNALAALRYRMYDATKSLSAIRSRVRREAARGQCALVIVDYLQLVRVSRSEAESRQEKVAEVARALKDLAADCRVPVVATCQVNRKAEDRAGGRPSLADLRESGEIEAASDAVLLLHRPNKYRAKSKGGDDGWTDLNLAKSRNTQTGDDQMIFERERGVLRAAHDWERKAHGND